MRQGERGDFYRCITTLDCGSVHKTAHRQKFRVLPHVLMSLISFGERMVGARGFEPPTPWSRTRFQNRLKSMEIGSF